MMATNQTGSVCVAFSVTKKTEIRFVLRNCRSDKIEIAVFCPIDHVAIKFFECGINLEVGIKLIADNLKYWVDLFSHTSSNYYHSVGDYGMGFDITFIPPAGAKFNTKLFKGWWDGQINEQPQCYQNFNAITLEIKL